MLQEIATLNLSMGTEKFSGVWHPELEPYINAHEWTAILESANEVLDLSKARRRRNILMLIGFIAFLSYIPVFIYTRFYVAIPLVALFIGSFAAASYTYYSAIRRIHGELDELMQQLTLQYAPKRLVFKKEIFGSSGVVEANGRFRTVITGIQIIIYYSNGLQAPIDPGQAYNPSQFPALHAFQPIYPPQPGYQPQYVPQQPYPAPKYEEKVAPQ
ncbi:hypothetical protein EDD86DRAFT_219901 [Gorgonomyces haynaldii]|nr:hypothetical protein EDD86DRAFT_219901 [Gorgonomyces haynaldii]